MQPGNIPKHDMQLCESKEITELERGEKNLNVEKIKKKLCQFLSTTLVFLIFFTKFCVLLLHHTTGK